MISILIPANNEERYIGACLTSLLQSSGPKSVQVIVVANGCTDNTAQEAGRMVPQFVQRGWSLEVLDLEAGGKIGALNAGDAAARHDQIIYMDADIRVSRDLVAQIAAKLETNAPVYVSGQPVVPPAQSLISRRYAQFWAQLPFIRSGVPGCGVFAVNAPARARWGAFPEVISDDTFVRYHFAPGEMHAVPASYEWPITEGFAGLVRVRRRQDEGLLEIQRRYPELAARMLPTAPDAREKLALFLKDPVGFVIYATVAITVRLPLFRNRGAWDRGR